MEFVKVWVSIRVWRCSDRPLTGEWTLGCVYFPQLMRRDCTTSSQPIVTRNRTHTRWHRFFLIPLKTILGNSHTCRPFLSLLRTIKLNCPRKISVVKPISFCHPNPLSLPPYLLTSLPLPFFTPVPSTSHYPVPYFTRLLPTPLPHTPPLASILHNCRVSTTFTAALWCYARPFSLVVVSCFMDMFTVFVFLCVCIIVVEGT